MDVVDELDALARDRARGASEIVREAAHLVPELAARSPNPRADVEQAVLDLARGHPAMAPVVNFAQRVLAGLDDQGLATLDPLATELSTRSRALASAGARVLDHRSRALTHSRSGSVLGAIREAQDPPRITISEARPGQEGLDVARRLDSEGYNVLVTYDARLPGLVDEADVVIVGADAITSNAFVNKAGTRAIFEAAQDAASPAVVIAGVDKLWPDGLPEPDLSIEGRLGLELPESVETDARLFETTPLELVDRIVTEDGPVPPDEIHERRSTADPRLGEALEPEEDDSSSG